MNPIYLKKITTIEEAKAFIDLLYADGTMWHFDDSPSECGFSKTFASILTDRQVELWNVAEDTGFDHFGYALALDPEYDPN